MILKEDIDSLKETSKKLEVIKSKAEAELSVLKDQEAELIKKMKSLGFNSIEELNSECEKLKVKLSKATASAKTLLDELNKETILTN